MQELAGALAGVEPGARLRVKSAKGFTVGWYHGVDADALLLTENVGTQRIEVTEIREIAVREGSYRDAAALGAMIGGGPLALYVSRDHGTPEIQALYLISGFVALVVGGLVGAGLGAVIAGLRRRWRVVYARDLGAG